MTASTQASRRRAASRAAPTRGDVWKGIAAAFAQHGFRTVDESLRRIAPPAVQVVHARYKSTRGGSLRFTLDLGVFFPQAYAKIRVLRPRKAPREGTRDCMCTIRCNVGALLGPEMVEHWWKVPAGAAREDVAGLVSDAVDNAAVPWLDRCSNPRLAMDETDRLDAISLALMLGDLETARRLALLAEVESTPTPGLHDWARRRWLVP